MNNLLNGRVGFACGGFGGVPSRLIVGTFHASVSPFPVKLRSERVPDVSRNRPEGRAIASCWQEQASPCQTERQSARSCSQFSASQTDRHSRWETALSKSCRYHQASGPPFR